MDVSFSTPPGTRHTLTTLDNGAVNEHDGALRRPVNPSDILVFSKGKSQGLVLKTANEGLGQGMILFVRFQHRFDTIVV